MSATFLATLMRVAQQQTKADRALTVDIQLTIVDALNLKQADIQAADFIGFSVIREALESGEPIITNNAVVDSSSAPKTNTNFSNLRVVVVIPVIGLGAIYLDQPIRRGIIAKDIVDRLMRLANQVIANDQTGSSETELHSLFNEIG
jgi:hypothetical protein